MENYNPIQRNEKIIKKLRNEELISKLKQSAKIASLLLLSFMQSCNQNKNDSYANIEQSINTNENIEIEKIDDETIRQIQNKLKTYQIEDNNFALINVAIKEWENGRVEDSYIISNPTDSTLEVTAKLGHLNGNRSEKNKEYFKEGLWGNEINTTINKNNNTVQSYIEGYTSYGKDGVKKNETSIYILTDNGQVEKNNYTKGTAEKFLKELANATPSEDKHYKEN